MESVVIPGQICDNPMAVRAIIAPVRITYTTNRIGISIEAVSSLVKEAIFFVVILSRVIKYFVAIENSWPKISDNPSQELNIILIDKLVLNEN
jgi:hypothetical protein